MSWVKEKFSKVPDKPKGWITVKDIVLQTGNNRRTVMDRLKAMVISGELQQMICNENGKISNCYRKIEKAKKLVRKTK